VKNSSLREPSQQGAYRGYLIRTNPLNGMMWVEKDGILIFRVPENKSWHYAHEQIDALVSP
jgi:hypothetical protein